MKTTRKITAGIGLIAAISFVASIYALEADLMHSYSMKLLESHPKCQVPNFTGIL